MNECGWGEKVAVRLNDLPQKNLKTARRAHKAGVRFAMRSAAVITIFEQNQRKLARFVNAADPLSKHDELGAVATAYFLDPMAFKGDPLS